MNCVQINLYKTSVTSFYFIFFGKRYIGCIQFSDPETKTKEGQPHLIVYILPVLIIDSYKGYSASKWTGNQWFLYFFNFIFRKGNFKVYNFLLSNTMLLITISNVS